MKKQVKKRGFGLMALALSSLLSVIGGRMAMAQTADPEAEGNVKIWLNNTDTPTDDVLPQGGALPCQAHLEGAGKDMTVVLVIPPLSSTNSARRLSFSNTSTVSTITLTLKKDTTSSPFTIYGISGSLDVGDAKIEAHKDTLGGALKTTGAASVYWFESPHMFVLQGGTYQLDNPNAPTTYTANSPAVYLRAQLQLRPQGVPTSGTPELASMGIGIVQNDLGGRSVVTYGNPTLTAWLSDSRSGDIAAYLDHYSETKQVPYQSNDSLGPAPLYDSPTTISSGLAISADTPTRSAIAPNLSAIVIYQGRRVAAVTYQNVVEVSVSGSWLDWCVTCNMSNNQVKEVLRQNSWSLDAHSGLNDQKASVGSDGPVTTSPNLNTQPSANTLINDPSNTHYSYSGSLIQTPKP